LELGKVRILIAGFIRFPPVLAICDVAHSPPGGVDRDIPFIEGETRTASLVPLDTTQIMSLYFDPTLGGSIGTPTLPDVL
jgi:hypothetical protein